MQSARKQESWSKIWMIFLRQEMEFPVMFQGRAACWFYWGFESLDGFYWLSLFMQNPTDNFSATVATTNANNLPDLWFIWICSLFSRIMGLVYFFEMCSYSKLPPTSINHMPLLEANWLGVIESYCNLLPLGTIPRKRWIAGNQTDWLAQPGPAHVHPESTDLRVTFKKNTKKKPSLITAATICL